VGIKHKGVYMAKEIEPYEVSNSYEEIKTGFRFNKEAKNG